MVTTTAAAAAAPQERGQTQENVIRIEDKHSFKYRTQKRKQDTGHILNEGKK